MTSDFFSLPTPWEPLSAEQAESFLRELDHRHPLYRLALTPLARSTAAEDVLWALPDGPVVVVHLTWSDRRETPPWPHFQIYPTKENWIEQLRRSEHHNNETATAEPHA